MDGDELHEVLSLAASVLKSARQNIRAATWEIYDVPGIGFVDCPGLAVKLYEAAVTVQQMAGVEAVHITMPADERSVDGGREQLLMAADTVRIARLEVDRRAQVVDEVEAQLNVARRLFSKARDRHHDCCEDFVRLAGRGLALDQVAAEAMAEGGGCR